MASEGDHKNHALKLFGVDLSQHYTNLSRDDHTVTASLGGETAANKESHNEVTDLEGSASKGTNSAQGSEVRIFPCRYCSRKFYNSKALGSHQKAHKNERTVSKSNPILNSLPTDCLKYPAVVGQQPTNAVFATNGRLSHNFEFQRVDLSSYQPRFHAGHQNTHKHEQTVSKSNAILNSPPTDRFPYPVAGQQPSHAIFASNPRLSHNFELQRVDLSNYQHQSAHQNERTVNKSNPILNSSPTDCFQYPVLGQQPSHAMFASNRKLSLNFELQRVDFQQWPHNFHFMSSPLSSVKTVRNDIELKSAPLSSLKRARNDIELASSSLPSVKRARNEDPQQHNIAPGSMVTTEDVELDFSLHL